MTRAKISQLDAAAANNTDINAVNVAEGCPPSGINNAIREMGAMLKRMDNGTDHLTDPNITGSLDVDNININGNTISSTDTNGNINITPNGSGAVAFTTNATFGDNNKAIFGAGSDMQIWHDGSNSIVYEGGTGTLKLATAGGSVDIVKGSDSSETMAKFNINGAAELYHDNSKKLETTSTGADITGTLTADGLTVAQSSPVITITDTDGSTNTTLKTVGSNTELSNPSGGNLRFRTNASELERIRVSPDGDISFFADDGTTQALFFDASTQRLGLGTTSPTAKLMVNGGSANYPIVVNSTDQIAGIAFADNTTSGNSNVAVYADGNALGFEAGNAERMRIDSSGNLLVGKTAEGVGNVGFQARPDGFLAGTRNGGIVSYLNRLSSDGEILRFQKDNTAVGSIRTGGSSIMIGNGDTGLFFDNTNDNIRVVNISTGGSRDNAVDLGESLTRFDDIYATNGTIQTSDQQEKNTITDSDLGLDFINRLSPKSYIFNGKTRTHYGLIAQEVETVLGDISKPTSGFAGFIKSDISEEEDGSEYRYGLRYTEFVGPLIQAIKDLKTENDVMRARLDALEAN